MEIDILNKFAEYGVTMLLLALIVYYFYKKIDKLENQLIDERNISNSKIDDLNKQLRESDKDNIEILNKVTDVIETLNDNNTESIKYLKSIRFMLKNNTD